MLRYFTRALTALVKKSPALYALTVIGVALGVASIVTIQLINANAIAAFAASVRAVTGDDELTVVSRFGGLDEKLLVKVLGDPDTQRARPVLRIDAVMGEQRLDIVATDLTQPGPAPLTPSEERFGDALSTPGWVAVSPKLGKRPGETLDVVSGSTRRQLVVGAVVDAQKALPLASSSFAVMDIAQAQAMFGAPGTLDEIDVDLVDGADVRAAAKRIGAALGDDVAVLTPDERAEEAAGLLKAFRLNLTALSLISIAVGVFLIHGALQATLLRRRTELGVLRALGATRAQVIGLVLGEVLLIGFIGTALGVPCGIAAARANIDVVSGTLTNLYLLEAVETLEVPTWVVAVGALVGMGSALLGATVSLLELRREDTRSLLTVATLQESLVALAPRLLVASVTVAGAAAVFACVAHGWAPAGFVIAVSILVVLVLATPWLVVRVARLLEPRALGFAFSVRTLGQKLASNAFAVAALAIAVSMMFGITLMVGSFRATLDTWIGMSIRADIYVSPLTHGRRGRAPVLSDEVLAALNATREARVIDTLRRSEVLIGDRVVRFSAVTVDLPGVPSRWPLMHDAEGVFETVRDRQGLLVSEPLARKAGLSRGDVVTVTSKTGADQLPVAGVFYDYTTEQGTVMVDVSTFRALVGEMPPANAALYLREGSDVDAVVAELQERLGDAPVVVRSNARLRATIMDIFDQTFAITIILQAMSFLIAVAGITLTLLVLARERAAELALYRALGATRAQVFRLFVGQGVALSLFGLALGAVGGAALVTVLILLINRAYFGWTIQLSLPAFTLAQQVVTIIGAAIIAALYPALLAARTPAQELVRDDL